MIRLLAALFIRDRKSYGDSKVRSAYGVLCSVVGIGLNLLLFALKYIAGVISGSIAITADAFNNLSDAGSSIITLIGFRLAGKKPDKDHPFGHGRIEYVAGLAVSFLILLMGFELGKSSVEKILHPAPVEAGWLPLLILVVSIFVKFYMFFYNRSIAKKISSAAMRATAKDSISDSVSTAVVLVCALVGRFTGLQIDGWAGLLVALVIVYAGLSSVKDTISPLLGEPPKAEFIAEIEELVLSHEHVSGVHDLLVHDYGPGRRMISLHAEVPADGDILEMHDVIDNIERELGTCLDCDAVIHMDPIAVNDENVARLRERVSALAGTLGEGVTIHDFRIVEGPSHTNLIFDLVLPFGATLTPEQARSALCAIVEEKLENCYAVITVERAYV